MCGETMQSARWERDKEVNSDSSNTVNRVRASKRKGEKTGRDKKLKRNEKHLHSVLKSCVKMKLSDFQRFSYSYI